MKIWLSKNSEIPVREQLVAQVTLGIVSGDLTAGERLPSTRELARRFGIHANTVGSAYQKLVEKNLIEFRRGSGFYICGAEDERANGKPNLDRLVAEFFRAAQALGFSRKEIFENFQKRIENKKPERVLIVEENEDLRRILIEEIKAATGCAVSGAVCGDFQNKSFAAGDCIIASMVDEKPKLELILPAASPRIYLTPRSVSNSMHGETRPENDDLIAVVSAWENFRMLAKTVLVAANINVDSIVIRSTKAANWRKGLENASLVICEAFAAGKFDGSDRRVRPFRLIADASLAKLKEFLDS